MAQVAVVVVVVLQLTIEVSAIRRRQAHHRGTMVVQVVDMPKEITPVVEVVAPVLRAVSGALAAAVAMEAMAFNLRSRA